MNILFLTAHPYLPQMYGGLQTSVDQLCHSLIERGHKVSILCALMGNGLTGFKCRVRMQINKRLAGCKVSRDTAPGYPVWRTWYPWEAVQYVAAKQKPDLIVVLAVRPVRMALAAKPTGIPVLMMLQDVEFSQHDGEFRELGKIPCIANSQFTAGKYRAAYGVDSVVIYPYIVKNNYKTDTTRENVTFINPVAKKGLDLALEIARRCPEIPFSFIESWPLSPEEQTFLAGKLSLLPNVTLLAPQKNMKNVYKKCKILLAPSMWEEGYGMVITEAQLSGIPAVASTRGGLPEAVGDGGVLLATDASVDEWVEAIRKLWNNAQYYSEKSSASLIHSHRPELDLIRQIDAYEKVFMTAATALKDVPAAGN